MRVAILNVLLKTVFSASQGQKHGRCLVTTTIAEIGQVLIIHHALFQALFIY